ncbi:MAG TPA: DUF6505 family protein, partial [Usitatibacter sp.]|nr:DUF6505 family protein [Usitatibacter sp.]
STLAFTAVDLQATSPGSTHQGVADGCALYYSSGTAVEMESQADALAWHLVRAWNAPSWEAARALAGEEMRHTAEVCETLEPDVWITVKRTRNAEGTAIEEQYSVYDRLMIGAHSL